MTVLTKKLTIAFFGLASLAFPLPSFAVSLVADYQFNNTLASSIDLAPSLFDLGTSNFFSTETVDGQSTTVFNFAESTGLQLSTAGLIPSDNYSIAALFNFDTVEGWKKIIDVNNRLTDSGLYTLDSNLNYYGKQGTIASGSSAPVTADKWVQVVFTRDNSNQVIGYVDGVQQLSFADDSGQAKILPDSVLYLFRDDVTTEDFENSSGSVARLRLYDGALTAAQVATLDRLPATPTAPSSEPEATFVPPTEFAPDPNDPIESATEIDTSSGSGIGSGSVGAGSQVFKFDASAGQLLTLDVDVTGINQGLIYQDNDSTLYLYNEAGEILAFNDNGLPSLTEGGESSLFNVLIPESGTYYAAVTTRNSIGSGTAIIEQGRPFNTITGFEGTGLSNIDFNLNVTSASIPATARYFEIALAANPSVPVGSFLVDRNTILNLVLNGQQNTSLTGLIDIIVGENTLTFSNFEFIVEFADPFSSTDINDVLNSLNGATATAIVPPDELIEQIIFSEKRVPGQPIPEPLTLLGAGTAIGFGALFKKNSSKKAKKDH